MKCVSSIQSNCMTDQIQFDSNSNKMECAWEKAQLVTLRWWHKFNIHEESPPLAKHHVKSHQCGSTRMDYSRWICRLCQQRGVLYIIIVFLLPWLFSNSAAWIHTLLTNEAGPPWPLMATSHFNLQHPANANNHTIFDKKATSFEVGISLCDEEIH